MPKDEIADGQDRGQYWDDFYTGRMAGRLAAPSQFAAFVAQEAAEMHQLLEIGCGNGRDSFFFARYGFSVVAFDGSKAAIDACEMSRQREGVPNLHFVHARVGSKSFLPELKNARESELGRSFAYARFFLHAITEDEEEALLRNLSEVLRRDDLVAFEYRTVRDASGAKVTPVHYRRFVQPSRVFASAGRLGFTVQYAVEGFGFAKYREDDAYVARCVLKKQ